MCCYVTKNATAALKAKMLAKGGTMTFYKVIEKNGGSPLQPYRWFPGLYSTVGESLAPDDKDYRTQRLVYENGKKCRQLHIGFHVFLTYHAAKTWSFEISEVVVPVTCNVKDLRGCEEELSKGFARGKTAVFRKVLVTEKAWKEAGF